MRKYISISLALLLMLSALAGCKLVQSPTGSAGTTVPPTANPTTEPTAPTTSPIPPTTVPEDTAEVRVCQSMTVAKWQGLRLRFSYSLNKEAFLPGDTIIATVQVTFLSYSLDITGSFADYLSPIALMWHDNGYYGFTSHTNPPSQDTTPQTLSRGDTVTATYTFTVPEDAMEGQYYMTFSAFDTMVRFDAQTAEACPNFMVCGDLPDEVLIAMWGGDSTDPYVLDSFDNHWAHRYNIILYGAFDGVYVYIDEYSYTSWWPKSETVNGLVFLSHEGYPIRVYCEKDDTFCSLTDAFESGLLSAEQLQIIYDNLTYMNEMRYAD